MYLIVCSLERAMSKTGLRSTDRGLASFVKRWRFFNLRKSRICSIFSLLAVKCRSIERYR